VAERILDALVDKIMGGNIQPLMDYLKRREAAAKPCGSVGRARRLRPGDVAAPAHFFWGDVGCFAGLRVAEGGSLSQDARQCGGVSGRRARAVHGDVEWAR
jgi:hypothetical protein